jgi:hypothetical protein
VEQAYLKYDPETGKIISVHWKNPGDDSLVIDSNLALSFMDGTNKLHRYHVITDSNGSQLVSAVAEEPQSSSQLSVLSANSIQEHVKIKVNKTTVSVSLEKEFPYQIGFYITLKNDLSWLIKSYNITSMLKKSTSRTVRIKVNNAEEYSYRVGIIDDL